MRAYKMFLVLVTFSFVATLSAVANTCNAFASYTCSKSTPNVVNLNGTGLTGQSVGVLLGNDTFGVSVNGKSFVGDDLVILAAFPNGMAGSVNGVSFNSLTSF